MDWKSHALIGALCAVVVAYALIGTTDLILFAVMAAFGMISALVPDLDHDSSKGKAILDIVFVSFAFFMVYFSGCSHIVCIPDVMNLSYMALLFFAFLGVYFLFFRFLKPHHRGITHTLVACFAFGVLTYLFVGMNLALAGVMGYLSHLVADRQIVLI